jgi:predicted amidophosphoribosyltransferase
MPNCKDCQPPLTNFDRAYCECCKMTYERIEQDKRIKAAMERLNPSEKERLRELLGIN